MDNSWDNSKVPPRAKTEFNWSGIAIGIALILTLVGLSAKALYWATQNQRKIEQWDRGQAREDWVEARRVVEKIQTEEGAIALYRSNPKLSAKFQTDRDFLKAISQWRPQMEPLPISIQTVASDKFGHRIGFGGGPAIVSFQMDNGRWLIISWDGPSTDMKRQLINIEFY